MDATLMIKKLIAKLRNKEYRDAYVEGHVTGNIPQQIRILREQRGWTQEELAQRINKTQTAISRLENADYGRQGVRTLLELASVFDVGLLVKFVPFSKFLAETRDLSVKALAASSFDDEADNLAASTHAALKQGGWQTRGVVTLGFEIPVHLNVSANDKKYLDAGKIEWPRRQQAA